MLSHKCQILVETHYLLSYQILIMAHFLYGQKLDNNNLVETNITFLKIIVT